VLEAMKANPYLKPEEAGEIQAMSSSSAPVVSSVSSAEPVAQPGVAQPVSSAFDPQAEEPAVADPEADESVSAYMQEHAHEIAAEGEKPFQSIGGVVELLGTDYFPHHETQETQAVSNATPIAGAAASAKPAVAAQAGTAGKTAPQAAPKRENTLQKINALDVKGRIQLALKGNKEERSILIRDGTKVVALAVLEAPKLADGEVEKFASQKNVLEAVLRQIPLKRRFMKNYIVVRNLVANPRTPIDLSLGLMKNLLTQDLKNISSNKEISETIRKLALKMYKQKLEAANKK
jgi:hypothetical protein